MNVIPDYSSVLLSQGRPCPYSSLLSVDSSSLILERCPSLLRFICLQELGRCLNWYEALPQHTRACARAHAHNSLCVCLSPFCSPHSCQTQIYSEILMSMQRCLLVREDLFSWIKKKLQASWGQVLICSAEELVLHHDDLVFSRWVKAQSADTGAKMSYPSEQEPLGRWDCPMEFSCHKPLCRTSLIFSFGMSSLDKHLHFFEGHRQL